MNSTFSISLMLGVVAACALISGCTRVEPAPDVKPLAAGTSVFFEEVGDVHDWTGWRGGHLHGVSAESDLPRHWNADEGVRWKVSVVGRGNSSPVVTGDRVILTSLISSSGAEQLVLLCLSRNDGHTLWRRELGSPAGRTHNKNGYASSTVATDGRRVFAFFGSQGIFCYDLNGRRIWHTDLDGLEQQWGTAASPLVCGNLVLQACDGESQSYIVALNKLTGEEVWQTSRASRGSWSSPVLVAAERGAASRAEIVVNGTGTAGGSPGQIIAYDPADGRELWLVRGTTDIPCPTAIVGGGLVVSTSGANGPVVAIRPGGSSDVTRTHVVWQHASGGPYVPTGVIYEDRLYTVSDGGVARCFDLKDGAELWKKRLPETFSASLVAADGCIYATSEQGTVFVWRAADRFELVAANRMDEACLATPAISRGEIFLRTSDHLYCIAGIASSSDPGTSAAGTVDGEPPNSPSDRDPDKEKAGKAAKPGSESMDEAAGAASSPDQVQDS